MSIPYLYSNNTRQTVMNFPKIDDTIEGISFHFEIDDIHLNEDSYYSWLHKIANNENYSIGNLAYIFCNDEYLQEINWRFLKHKSLTDIITFQYEKEPIEAEIYISVERVRENAVLLNVPIDEELRRVIVHGLLHCCGYKDKTDQDKKMMRQKENESLSLLSE